MNGKKIQAALFDLDGTCVDSDDLHFKAYQQVLFKTVPELNDGEPITRRFYDTKMSGRQNREIMADLGEHLPLEVQTAVWQEKERIYGSFLDCGVKPLKGLVEFLDTLDNRGIRFALVTNAPREMAQRTLDALELARRFGDRIVIADECARYKPAPDPYLKGLEMLKTACGNALAFEDSPSGMTSACAAGIFTVGVMSSRTEKDLTAAGARVCISDYTDEKVVGMLE